MIFPRISMLILLTLIWPVWSYRLVEYVWNADTDKWHTYLSMFCLELLGSWDLFAWLLGCISSMSGCIYVSHICWSCFWSLLLSFAVYFKQWLHLMLISGIWVILTWWWNASLKWFFIKYHTPVTCLYFGQLRLRDREKACWPLTSAAPYISWASFCCGWIKCPIWEGFSCTWKASCQLAMGNWLSSIWTILEYFPN